jgi:hypothetical protein
MPSGAADLSDAFWQTLVPPSACTDFAACCDASVAPRCAVLRSENVATPRIVLEVLPLQEMIHTPPEANRRFPDRLWFERHVPLALDPPDDFGYFLPA